MRDVFATPKPFISDLVNEISANSFSGVNMWVLCVLRSESRSTTFLCRDWEPTTSDVTPEDALAYAKFLDTLADAVHKVDAILTVDIAHWGAIWNFTALAGTSVDHFMTMGTYTDDSVAWKKYVNNAVSTFSREQLVVGKSCVCTAADSHYIYKGRMSAGLETTKASNGQPYSVKELQQRFDYLASLGVHSVGLWKAPVPATFWPLLHDM